MSRGSLDVVATALCAASAVLAVDTLLADVPATAWRTITAQVATEYRGLPREDTPTAVVTNDYWSAAALHHFGPDDGLAEVYSPSRGFWYLGRADDTVERVVYLGSPAQRLRRLFGTVRRLGTIRTQVAVPADYNGTPVWLASNPRMPWPQVWLRLRHMSLW